MAVELAVLIPVIVVVALVVFNLGRFVALCATFDRASMDAVISQGVSPAGSARGLAAVDEVCSCIEDALGRSSSCHVEVSVERASSDGGGALTLSPLLTRFRCTLSYAPWPSAFVIAGVPFDAPLVLRHERTLVVDRYRPGVVM